MMKLSALATALALSLGLAAPAAAQQDFTQDWQGFYAGAHIDMSLFSTNNSDLNNQFNSNAPEKSLLLPNGGIMLGYNRELRGGLIVGGEFEYSSTLEIDEFISTNEIGSTGTQVLNSIDGLMAIKMRAGAQTDNVLTYVTGGYAFGTGMFETYQVDTGGGLVSCDTSTCARSTEDLMGVTIGAGVEWAFRENWIARFEVQHTAFQDLVAPVLNSEENSACASGDTGLCSVIYSPNVTAAKLGVVYRF